jgi:hypothetical protein
MGGVAAEAQTYRLPNYRHTPYYDEGRYGRQGPGYPADPAAVAQRVIRDLDFAARSSYVDRHEREHFARAVSELQAFQSRWQQRRVETGHLDRAIDNMKDLAEARQVDRRARRVIDQDIEVLRDLRARVRRYRD